MEGARGVPMEESVAGDLGVQPVQQARRRRIERGRVARLGQGAGGLLGLELGEAERDGRLYLVRQVKILAGHVGKEGVYEMQATQLVAVHRHFLFLPTEPISLMNSETSRNSLYTLA